MVRDTPSRGLRVSLDGSDQGVHLGLVVVHVAAAGQLAVVHLLCHGVADLELPRHLLRRLAVHLAVGDSVLQDLLDGLEVDAVPSSAAERNVNVDHLVVLREK